MYVYMIAMDKENVRHYYTGFVKRTGTFSEDVENAQVYRNENAIKEELNYLRTIDNFDKVYIVKFMLTEV